MPTIDSATNPATIDEIAGDSSAQNIPATTGTITFTDQDLGDSLSLSVTGECQRHLHTQSGAEGTVPNDPAVNVSALIASGAISFSDNGLTSTGGQQTIDWTYDPDAADLDWLQDGTLSRSPTPHKSTTVQGAGSQDLVITINGTNDVPTIDSATNPPPSTKSPVTAPLKTFLPPLAPSPSPTRTSGTLSLSPSPVMPPPPTHPVGGGGQWS